MGLSTKAKKYILDILGLIIMLSSIYVGLEVENIQKIQHFKDIEYLAWLIPISIFLLGLAVFINPMNVLNKGFDIIDKHTKK